MSKSMKYILLFPGLAIFSFNLLVLGKVGFSAEYEFFGRRLHELESLTFSAGKSLTNLSEIYIAIFVGLAACGMLHFKWPKKIAFKQWRVVGLSYLLVVIVYFAMPALPE
jgi:hypothetical protein